VKCVRVGLKDAILLDHSRATVVEILLADVLNMTPSLTGDELGQRTSSSQCLASTTSVQETYWICRWRTSSEFGNI
jgi:hypothetical protein